MPHTVSRYQQDLGFTDGAILLPAADFVQLPTVAGPALTRNGPSDFSWNVGAATGPLNLSVNLSDGQIIRTGFGEDLMEQFGGTGIPASAQVQRYRPDVLSAMNTGQQLQPRTSLKQKGIKPLSLKLSYLINGAALTTHTCRLDQIIYANNLVNVVNPVIASGANGLATAVQANPYVTVIPLPVNQQVYQITDLASLYFEVTVTTAGGGTYRLNSLEVTFEFNYN